MSDNDTRPELEQPALFNIEGPDEDGCVWFVGEGEEQIVANGGPREAVAEKVAEWLAQIDFGKGGHGS